MKTKKIPVIILPHGCKTRLAKEMGVSTETVRKALKFITESDEACLIREKALKHYRGVEVEMHVRSQK